MNLWVTDKIKVDGIISWKDFRENVRNGLKIILDNTKKSQYIGLDFDKKPLDFVKMAQAFDMKGVRVESPDELIAAVKTALASKQTEIIDVVVDGAIDSQTLRSDWRSWEDYDLLQ